MCVFLLSWIIGGSPVYIRFILLLQNSCSFQRFHRDGIPFRLRFTSALPKSAIHINVSVSQKHQVLNLNLRDILTHIKMQDNLFLHFIALIFTWLNAKFHAKYTLKQVQGNKFLVQNSAKIGTKVQE